jgi:hypothetical protein
MEFDNLHQILRSLYEQMMPLCADMAQMILNQFTLDRKMLILW